MMKQLGIDASNICDGGGLTHLVELLHAAKPVTHGFEKIYVWAPSATLAQIKEKPWIMKRSDPLLEQHYLQRAFWQRKRLSQLLKFEKCDLLFVLGGSFTTDFRPVVVMNQNLLPFEWRELLRFGLSRQTLRLILLRFLQSRSLHHANGSVFLTKYAMAAVLKVTGEVSGATTVVPHGVDTRFANPPRKPKPLESYCKQNPFQFLYVSSVDVYKHQWKVAGAVANLRMRGYPIALDLVGAAFPPSLKRLRRTMDKIDRAGAFVRYLGAEPHDELPARYASADACVFASSCENLPNILLEGMASGLPIACSDRGPMPELLGDAAVYFNPELQSSIEEALERLLNSPELRYNLAKKTYQLSQKYTWDKCADQTFDFLSQCIRS